MSPSSSGDHGFRTVFGRELVPELRHFVHRPYLVVTMADLWPQFEGLLAEHLAAVHLVDTLELAELERQLAALPPFEAVIGLGGGQAVDVAKFMAWRRRVPLFQVPTALTTNAPFAHRAVVRHEGKALSMAWAIPEAVYIDYEVIRAAPSMLNRSGVGDHLCFHTAAFDWRLAHDTGHEEARWPYDESMIEASRQNFERVLADLDEIRAVTDKGIRALTMAHRWGGAAFHADGWNDRHMDGVDHAFLYCLEYVTGHHFVHGQAVGLGTYVGAVLQENDPETILGALRRAGVDIRPESMGITWDDTATAMRRLAWYVRFADQPYTIADAHPVTDADIERVRSGVDVAYGQPVD